MSDYEDGESERLKLDRGKRCIICDVSVENENLSLIKDEGSWRTLYEAATC